MSSICIRTRLRQDFSRLPCPLYPRGTYRIYGDIVHESGFAETAVGEAMLPDVPGQPMSGDDAAGPSLPRGGYEMIWLHDKTKPGTFKQITATQLNLFSFRNLGHRR